MDWITASKVMGLKKIFSYINTGVMASAVAERGQENGERTLWLFRNSMPAGQQDRPLYVIDVRDKLGQIFFCSTDVLWRKAMAKCPQARQFIGRRWCIEMPADEIWYFNTNMNVPVPDDSTCKKLDVTRGHVWRPLEDVSSPLPIIGSGTTPPFSVISYLNDEDDLAVEDMPKVAHKKRHQATERWYPIGGSDTERVRGSLMEITTPGVTYLSEEESINKDADFDLSGFDEFETGFDLTALNKLCGEIKQVAADIQTTVENKHMEGSMTAAEFQSTLEALEQNKLDLEGILTIAEQN